jgi:hypothetical protein
MEKASYELGYEDRHTIEGALEEGRKEAEEFSSSGVGDSSGSSREGSGRHAQVHEDRERRLAILEDTRNPENCLDT